MLRKTLVAGCLVGFASVAFAADLAGFNPNDVPECGLLCISGTVLQNSSCSPTDFACVCANGVLIGEIEACIAHSCPPRDALTTARIAKALCGVESRNINLAVWLVPLVTIILSTIFFILKLVSRFALQQQVDISDITLGVSVALTLPNLWVAFRLSQLGLGHDVWSIPQDNITKILYLYWWAEIIYQSGLPLTRISILFFYLKVFPQKHIRWASFALIGLNAANLFAFVLATIFQCSPIYGAWTFWDGTFQGHCNDLHLQSWVQAGINIVLDLTTIILPLPLLAKLSASRGRKIRIMIMFALGFFITIISVLRLRTLVVFANSTNVSYDYVEPGLYSIIEASVSIICGCLPSVRALLLTITPKLLTLTNRTKLSNSQTPPGESSRQKFDRLDDCESANSPIKVKNEWSIHSESTHQGLESGSNVELVTMDTTRSRNSMDSEHEEATRTIQSVNWSRPLPRSHEGGLT